MVEENKTATEKVEKKPRVKKIKTEIVATPTEKVVETKTEAPKSENAVEQKTETKKPEVKKEKVVKEKAIVNGFSLPISTKQSMAICRMIRGKTPERAIEMLEAVLKFKMAVPMRGLEVGHRRRGLMPDNAGGAGRFPKNASETFINLLKQLKANCEVNGIENAVITMGIPNLASRPFKREGRRAKRTNVYLEAQDRNKLKSKKNKRRNK